MKIERAWLRIILSVIIAGIAGFVLFYVGTSFVFSQAGAPSPGWLATLILLCGFLAGPLAAATLVHMFTPRETKDGHTRCGKCGYILKGLAEPRCSECGERI